MKRSRAGETESIHPLRDERRRRVPRPPAPQKIGRYELCFELGSGGMASVHLARVHGSHGVDKVVALKRIHPHLALQKDHVEMFLDEARIASRITHGNVCAVFDYGEAEGEYFIAMEYLLGESLARVHHRVLANADQRHSPLLPAHMARIIAQACEGLHAAHELSDSNGESLHVVHRDVSADNLFVTYDGTTRIVDFGVAHASQRLHATDAGQVKGTFPYMAPEQMTAAVVDRRVDVWALGAVLWEMLTLRKLFQRDNDVNTMFAVLSAPIKAPSEFRNDIPAELDEIVLKALKRNPDERWQTTREMGKALRRYLASQDELVGPAEIAEWMSTLFPNGELRRRELMELARSGDAAIVQNPPQRAELQTGKRPSPIPATLANRLPPAPPLPASLFVMLVGVVAVLAVVTIDWLRQ